MEQDLFGSMIEFKVDSSLIKLSQAFANMVRVAHDMIYDTLKRGEIVNTIKVYGLVVCHKEEKCLPMTYCCDFTKNWYQIDVGQETDFYKAFCWITLAL